MSVSRNYWNNECVSGTTGTVVIHPVPVDTRHLASTNPAKDAAVPTDDRRRRLDVGWRQPGVKLVTLSVSAPAERRWSHHSRRVWRRAVAWFQPPEGGSTSIGSSSPRINGAEGATLLRASSPPPAEYTGTTCIFEVTAAAPGILRHPATWRTRDHLYPYICRSQQ